jgi:hypothetical protein
MNSCAALTHYQSSPGAGCSLRSGAHATRHQQPVAEFMKFPGINLLQLMLAKQIHDRLKQFSKIICKNLRAIRFAIRSRVTEKGFSETLTERDAIIFNIFQVDE